MTAIARDARFRGGSPAEPDEPDPAGVTAAAAPTALPVWRIAAGAALVFAATRVALGLLTLASVHLAGHLGGAPSGLLEAWDQWDTHWYLLISRLGYFDHSTPNFFPLYPVLVGGLATVLGHGAGPVWPHPDPVRLVAALAVANLGALAGFIGLALLGASEDGDPAAGWRVLRVWSAYPFAFFSAAAYTEGPFLAEVALALLLARRGRWAWALLPAALAGLTRSTALALALPLAYEYGRHRGLWSRLRRPPARHLLGLAASTGAAPAGMAVFFLYCWRRFGDPLTPLHTQQSIWGHQLWPLWRTAREIVARLHHAGGSPMLVVDTAAVLLFAGLTLACVRRQPVSFTLLTAGLLYLALAGPTPHQPDLIASSGRYLTAALPVFLVLAGWASARVWLDVLLVAGGFMLQALLVLIFMRGGPVL